VRRPSVGEVALAPVGIFQVWRLVRRVLDTVPVLFLVQHGVHLFVPLLHFLVWSVRKDLSWDVFGKEAAVGLGDVPELDRFLQEDRVFLGAQQQLEGLPTDKAGLSQTWYAWSRKGIRNRLQAVEAAKDLIHIGHRMVRGVEQQRVIVPADVTIESSKSSWSDFGGWPGVELALRHKSAIPVCSGT